MVELEILFHRFHAVGLFSRREGHLFHARDQEGQGASPGYARPRRFISSSSVRRDASPANTSVKCRGVMKPGGGGTSIDTIFHVTTGRGSRRCTETPVPSWPWPKIPPP